MIRLLSQADTPLLEGLCAESSNACRIKAIWRAYGMGCPFVRFFGNEDGSLLIGEEDGLAVLWCSSHEQVIEAAEFLPLLTREVLSEMPLRLPGFLEEQGTIYERQPFDPLLLDGVKTDIGSAYPLLTEVFPGIVPEGNYEKWYADFSHRLRHGMSKVYTLPGVVTATAYCLENGRLMLSQLGVAEAERGKGWGKQMLAHICADNLPFSRLILHSQDKVSDGFYTHMGFEAVGKWYYYGREEEEVSKGI